MSTIQGNDNNNKLVGTDQDDTLYGLGGDDILDGGKGNDVLLGGAGNDTYIFNSGHDTISDNQGNNVVKTSFPVTFSDLTFDRYTSHWNELVIQTKNPANSLAIDNYFGGDTNITLKLSDGSFVPLNSQSLLITTHGTDGNDYLEGNTGPVGSHDDTLLAGLGDDELHGLDGNDTLVGGKGTDLLFGGDGDDVYKFAMGDGHDTIVEQSNGGYDRLLIGDGVTFNDLSFDRNMDHWNDLTINIKGSANTVHVDGYFGGSTLEEVRLADGSVISLESNQLPIMTHGTDGNDYLEGNTGPVGSHDDTLLAGLGNDELHGLDGNDTLVGGKGNDLLFGGDGDDVYKFALGDGQDTIVEQFNGGYDRLLISGDVKFDDLTFNRYTDHWNDLTINIKGSANTVHVDGYFGGNTLEEVRLADGTVISLESNHLPITTHGTDGNDYLEGNTGPVGSHDDTLLGGKGDDTLRGLDGNDVLTGGAGVDDFIVNGTKAGGIDEITDFHKSQNDKLEISDLLQGYHAGTNNINDYVSFKNSGTGSVMSVDLDGKGTAYSATQVAVLDHVTNLHADDLLAHNQLIVHS